jgi:hypothetical protein
VLKTDIVVISERINKNLETEIIKVSRAVSSLREEAEKKTQVIYSKFNSLGSSVDESLEMGMSETKRIHEILSEKLSGHETEAESKIDNTQTDTVNLRQEMIVGNLCVLEERLEAKNYGRVNSRLEKFDCRLVQFSVQVTALHSTEFQPAADGGLNRVHNINDNHATSIPASVLLTMSKSRSTCR